MNYFKSKKSNWESIKEYLDNGNIIKDIPAKRHKSATMHVKCNSSFVNTQGKRDNESGKRYATKRMLYHGAKNIMNIE